MQSRIRVKGIVSRRLSLFPESTPKNGQTRQEGPRIQTIGPVSYALNLNIILQKTEHKV